MKLKQWVGAKIHGVRVTRKGLGYNGSAAIPPDLMDMAGIEEYEAIHVLNKSNGQRFVTYAIRGEPGSRHFVLNGAAARLGEVGDECLIVTYCQSEEFHGAEVVFVDKDNCMCDRMIYGPDSFPHPDEGDDDAPHS